MGEPAIDALLAQYAHVFRALEEFDRTGVLTIDKPSKVATSGDD